MPGKRKAPYKRTLLLTGFAMVILVFAVAILFGATLFQEGNPVPVIQALAELELSGTSIAQIPGEPVKYVQRTGSLEPLTDYLAERGWTFREQLGAAVFYEQDEEALFVEMRMLTRCYVVYELDRTPK